MRIISYNVNGIRAAIKKGFWEWLATDQADVVCLQETKATPGDVDLRPLEALGYHHHWFSAQKKGYSGVAIFSKQKPDEVWVGTGIASSDAEGRVISARFGKYVVINAYFPSGTSGDERQQFKYVWLNDMQQWLQTFEQQFPNLILCGDYNIAHQEIDIHDPKGNKNSSGFLPEERAWMTQFLTNGWIDSFRAIHGDAPHHYSWWSQRFPSVRLQNKGWRIDYICTTTALKKKIVDARILPDVKHSDHCPVYLEIKK